MKQFESRKPSRQSKDNRFAPSEKEIQKRELCRKNSQHRDRAYSEDIWTPQNRVEINEEILEEKTIVKCFFCNLIEVCQVDQPRWKESKEIAEDLMACQPCIDNIGKSIRSELFGEEVRLDYFEIVMDSGSISVLNTKGQSRMLKSGYIVSVCPELKKKG